MFCDFFFSGNMASRKDAHPPPKGKKKPPATKRLPFLRAGEEKNISPSKFSRVLQYISEEEFSEMEMEAGDGDDDADDERDDGGDRRYGDDHDSDGSEFVPVSDSSVDTDAEEDDEFEDPDEEEIRDVGDDDDGGDGGSSSRKRKRASTVGSRVRQRVKAPRGRRARGGRGEERAREGERGLESDWER